MSLSLFASCKKEEVKNETPFNVPQKSKMEMLTQTTWKFSGYSANPAMDWYGDGVLYSNLYDLLDSCRKNVELKLDTDSTYKITYTLSSCIVGDIYDYEQGRWDINKSLDTLSFTPLFGCCSRPYFRPIINLNTNELKIKFSQYEIDGERTYVETYKNCNY